MRRRLSLKQMAVALGGMITVPTWAYGWNQDALKFTSASLLPPELETLLSEVVDTLIPATDTPGARELGVDKFILTMLRDCYEKEAQDKLASALQTIDERAKQEVSSGFTACTQAQRTQVLAVLDKENKEQKEDRSSAFSLLKNLTIQGYLNSEYVMKNLLKYELIPARYHGCVPVNN
ncbi:gluconate 2-dehydrogenase subunit 3 family protein [Rhodocytophaga rosea]|uniref:Gluconate 2-dehydrogenase subunit 3 family protein n=1 Tax=Rhodocytophaga rosea TaxID=2704465 RepID=A0A6C0GUQ5_9BACT|nr:gluconate 2-dehydrogenase subunit 3 family protein [Rhodocytophaga rosea]QHT71293.1 gluconate 2-dehydrogenase subunit 3 family protein [Rhodocytophaga rosea]